MIYGIKFGCIQLYLFNVILFYYLFYSYYFIRNIYIYICFHIQNLEEYKKARPMSAMNLESININLLSVIFIGWAIQVFVSQKRRPVVGHTFKG